MKRIISCLFCFGLLGCSGQVVPNSTTVAGGDAAAGVTSMLANIAGTLQSTFLTVVREPIAPKSFLQKVFNELFGFANATITSCTSSVFSDTCASGATGIKQANYSSCTLTGTSSFSGSVTLQYSNTSCAFTAATQTVTRLSEIVRTVNAYDTFTTSTGSRTDYRGTSIGGGTTLVKTAGGYELNVPGFNKFYTRQTSTVTSDVSIKSTANITVTDPTATSITFTGGSLEVVDSTHQFVASYVPTNVVINYSTCCYPTSGTMAVTYSAGTLSGTATVTFGNSSCGTATLTASSYSGAVPLWGCQ